MDKANSDIRKIVITGGPCAGKTTALGFLRNQLERNGIPAVLVFEAATDLILADTAPWTCASTLEFQTQVIALQLERESAAEAQAAELGEGAVVVCDRGVFDSRAYLTAEEFNAALATNGLDERGALARYDAVFHLESIALADRGSYTQANNGARFENAAEAVLADKRTRDAWSAHPRVHVIPNADAFEAKARNLADAVMAHLQNAPCFAHPGTKAPASKTSSAALQGEGAARARLRADIEAFKPFNEQETADKQVILHALDTDPDCFERKAQAHMARSIWVIDPGLTQTLLVYHNIYNSWSWIGGHADGESDLKSVALHELEEETGVRGARIVPCGPGDIYSLEVLTVNGHEKRGAYVSSHLHLNVTYLAIADPEEAIRVKPDENSGVRWAPLEDAIRLSTEPWIRSRIYRKLIDKLADVEGLRPLGT